MIVQIVAAFLDEKLTSFSLVLDQSRDDFADSFEDLFFALAEGHLIADLIQITHELGPFAEQSSHSHIDLGERAEHFIDLLGRDECREMEHHADAQAGPDIGGASGEVAQLFCEGVGKFALEDIVEIIHSLPCGLQVETALHDLQPKMVFFVDHDTESFLGVEDHCARSFGFAEFVADQLPFHQKLAIEITEFCNVDVFGLFSERKGFECFSDSSCDGGPVLGRAFTDEREVRKVSGQANATAHDDVGFGAVASHPFAGLLG